MRSGGNFQGREKSRRRYKRKGWEMTFREPKVILCGCRRNHLNIMKKNHKRPLQSKQSKTKRVRVFRVQA